MIVSNLASSLVILEKCSIWSLRDSRLEVAIFVWICGVFSLKLGLSDGFSILIWLFRTSLFVVEIISIGVCRLLSIDGAVFLRKQELISDKFIQCNWFLKGHIVYYQLFLWKKEPKPCGVTLFMILLSSKSLIMTLSIRTLSVFDACAFIM